MTAWMLGAFLPPGGGPFLGGSVVGVGGFEMGQEVEGLVLDQNADRKGSAHGMS